MAKIAKHDGSVTKKQQEFVREAVKKDPKVKMYGVLQLIKKKFGGQSDYYKLREAYLEAGGTVSKVMGGHKASGKKVGRPPKSTAGKPVASVSSVATKVERGGAGRRKADQAAAHASKSFSSHAQHIVIVTMDGTLDTYTFDNREQARNFVESQFKAGTASSQIAHYVRESLEVAVGV